MEDKANRQSRLQQRAYSALGLIPICVGSAFLFYIYAFSSMVNPRLTEHERRALIFKNMFLSPSLLGVLIGLILVLCGLCILLSGFLKMPRAVIIVAVVACFASLLAMWSIS